MAFNRRLVIFADVSGNRLPFSRRLKIAQVKFTYSKGYTGGLPLCPLIFSFSYPICAHPKIVKSLFQSSKILAASVTVSLNPLQVNVNRLAHNMTNGDLGLYLC